MQEKEDKISIIVPIYNAAPFLEKCVGSIVGQTYKNLEIILVNDGSKDNSLEILQSFAKQDARVVVVDKPNGGIGTAYKAGLEVMTGDAVYFVDSDDWLEPDAMEGMMALMKEHDADYVAMNMAFTEHREGHIFYIKDEVVEGEEIFERQFAYYDHSTICRLHKRHLLDNVVIFDQNIAVDAQITPQVLVKAKRGYITTKSYYNTLVREGSVSRSIISTEKQAKDTMGIYRFIIDFMKKNIPNHAHRMQLRYVELLIEMCKGALFVRNNQLVPLLPEIYAELDSNYSDVKNSGILQSRSKKNQIQMEMLIRRKNIVSLLAKKGILQKFGFYSK